MCKCRSRRIADIERRSADSWCVQDTRSRVNSDKMIGGKAAQYQLLWTENENGLGAAGTFLAEKWVGEGIDISRFCNRMIY